MGFAFSAPLAALGSCVGSCAGAACCKLATVGSTSGPRAARCLLWWLQLFAICLAVLLMGNGQAWLSTPCDKLHTYAGSRGGICECRNSQRPNECWQQQLAYRVEASAFIIFSGLLVLTASGCVSGAAKGLPVLKFLLVPVIVAALMFVSNSVLDSFGAIAGVLSSGFLVVQCILLIDFAYSWNERWHANSIAAGRSNPAGQGQRMWLTMIVVAAALFLLAATIGAVCLWSAHSTGVAHGTILGSAIVSLFLLAVSITDWCEHGTLLTSAVITAYAIWLAFEALATLPLDEGNHTASVNQMAAVNHTALPTLLSGGLASVNHTASVNHAGAAHAVPWWAALSMATFVLATSTGEGESCCREADSQGVELAVVRGGESEAAEDGQARDVLSEGAQGPTAWDFAMLCSTHALSTLYIASALVPKRCWSSFTFRLVALFASLALYGWSLIAPMVLTNREF